MKPLAVMSVLKAVFILSLLTAQLASAQVPTAERKFVSLIFENDIFFQEDGGYTNGIGIAYGRGPFKNFDRSNTPAWLRTVANWSYISQLKDRKFATSYLFGQVMNTPENITESQLLENQQPYSGALLLRSNLYAINTTLTDRLGIIVGVVGPASQAEESQKVIHRLTNGTNPAGWDNQLNNEFVFRLEAGRVKRLQQLQLGRQLMFDVSGSLHGGLGSLSSDLGAGLGLRMGSNLSNAVHVATQVPGREVNPIADSGESHWYLFLQVLGHYVFNDISIDGNYFSDSPGVDLIHEQSQITYGFSFNLGHWAFNYTRAVRSDRYRDQPKDANFGSVNITYSFK